MWRARAENRRNCVLEIKKKTRGFAKGGWNKKLWNEIIVWRHDVYDETVRIWCVRNCWDWNGSLGLFYRKIFNLLIQFLMNFSSIQDVEKFFFWVQLKIRSEILFNTKMYNMNFKSIMDWIFQVKLSNQMN